MNRINFYVQHQLEQFELINLKERSPIILLLLLNQFAIILNFNMSESNFRYDDTAKKANHASRADKLKEIDALYRAQIKQIYTESKNKIQKVQTHQLISTDDIKRRSTVKNQIIPTSQILLQEKQMQNAKSVSTLKIPQSNSSSKMFSGTPFNDDKVRASTFLKGQSTRTIEATFIKGQSTKTIESLRRQNENKELKIRELSNKCQNLIQKLKKHLGTSQFQAEMENIKEYADSKMQRLENLFKIKQEEIFFKLKLQVIALLQDFNIPKEQLGELNELSTENNLFTYMCKKIKTRLKDFRSKEQESSFQLQKDKILSQKQQQRIHYLTETNQLHKLSESKQKAKIQDLKNQLNQYLEKLKIREQQNQHSQNEIFRLKKQNQQLQSVNQKLSAAHRAFNGERNQEKSVWEAKQKQMKNLLNSYFVQKQKLEGQLQEKEEQIQEKHIKQKFLQQENQRLSRQLVRWKERYQGLQKEKASKFKQLEEEKNNLLSSFQDYKIQHSQAILLAHRNQIDQALRKIEEYQRAYEGVLLQLNEERRLLQRSEEQNQDRIEKMERQWIQRVKRLQKIKQQQLYEVGQDFQSRIRELRQQYTKKEQFLSEEMQARMRALLAQRDKKTTQQLIQLETQNDQLRREIEDLNKIIQVKESLINVINNKKLI